MSKPRPLRVMVSPFKLSSGLAVQVHEVDRDTAPVSSLCVFILFLFEANFFVYKVTKSSDTATCRFFQSIYQSINKYVYNVLLIDLIFISQIGI